MGVSDVSWRGGSLGWWCGLCRGRRLASGRLGGALGLGPGFRLLAAGGGCGLRPGLAAPAGDRRGRARGQIAFDHDHPAMLAAHRGVLDQPRRGRLHGPRLGPARQEIGEGDAVAFVFGRDDQGVARADAGPRRQAVHLAQAARRDAQPVGDALQALAFTQLVGLPAGAGRIVPLQIDQEGLDLFGRDHQRHRAVGGQHRALVTRVEGQDLVHRGFRQAGGRGQI